MHGEFPYALNIIGRPAGAADPGRVDLDASLAARLPARGPLPICKPMMGGYREKKKTRVIDLAVQRELYLWKVRNVTCKYRRVLPFL